MDEHAVAIAALGVLGSSVALMAWVVKKVLSDIAPALAKHAETAEDLSTAVKRNTESSDELLTFMKRLNGRLDHAVIQKVAEQTVEHQTVQHMEQS